MRGLWLLPSSWDRLGLKRLPAASANLNPWTEAKVDTKIPSAAPCSSSPARRTTPSQGRFANASYKRQNHNEGVTEIVEIPARGYALTIDDGWREVAEKALAFVERFT